MKTILAATALMALAAFPVLAQTREPSLTLYDQPGFKGRSVTLFADNLDLSDTGVVGTARSVQVFGQWRVCEAPGWRGRCQTLSRNIADLAALGIAGRVVSAALDGDFGRESYAPAPYAFDVEDYSGAPVPAPPIGWGELPPARAYAPAPRPRPRAAAPTPPRQVASQPPPARRTAPAPTPRVYAAQPSPARAQPSPAPAAAPALNYPDYGGGPAFGPASR